MDKFATRRKRLAELIATRYQGNAASLAAETDISPSYLYRMLSAPDAEHHKRIGEKMAEKIETVLKLPKNWLSGESSAVAKAIKGEAEQDPYALIEAGLKGLVIVGKQKEKLLERIREMAEENADTREAVIAAMKDRP